MVNKHDYIIYYVYTPVQIVNYCDRLGRCFRFAYIYACTGTSMFLYSQLCQLQSYINFRD